MSTVAFFGGGGPLDGKTLRLNNPIPSVFMAREVSSSTLVDTMPENISLTDIVDKDHRYYLFGAMSGVVGVYWHSQAGFPSPSDMRELIESNLKED